MPMFHGVCWFVPKNLMKALEEAPMKLMWHFGMQMMECPNDFLSMVRNPQILRFCKLNHLIHLSEGALPAGSTSLIDPCWFNCKSLLYGAG